MYFSSDILYNRFLPQSMGLALSCTPKGSAALKSCANQWHQACGTDSYPKADWAGKETSPVWPVSPALQPRWICQSCRCYLMSPSTSDLLQEIICSTAETLWGIACDANGTRSRDWFLFLLLFPSVTEKPFLMVLMAVRRDTDLCCNFFKAWACWSQTLEDSLAVEAGGAAGPSPSSLTKCCLPRLCAAPVAALVDNPLTTSSL